MVSIPFRHPRKYEKKHDKGFPSLPCRTTGWQLKGSVFNAILKEGILRGLYEDQLDYDSNGVP